MIAVSISAAEAQAAARSPDRAHTVFRVEVLCNGRRHTVVKRYSEFQALHKRIKKTCKVPDFPPRHVPNWMPKVLEQRRQGLELYIRGVLYHNEELPQDVLDFLKLRRCQQDPKASSSPSTGRPPSQRPVVGFCTDPYAQPPGTRKEQVPKASQETVLLGPQNVFPLPGPAAKRLQLLPFPAEPLPDTVLSGVLQGLYLPPSCTPSQAAPCAHTPHPQHLGPQW